MRWREVVEAFLNKESASGSNCYSTGNKLFSYSTCIGQYINDILYVNVTKYSPTTSKLQNVLLRSGPRMLVELQGIPRDTDSLSYILRCRQ